MSAWDPSAERHVHTLDADGSKLRLTVDLPSYFKFLPDQHHHLHISSSDESVISVPPFEITDISFDWELPMEVHGEGDAVLHLEGQVFFCPVTDATICIWATIDEMYDVRVLRNAGHRLELVYDIDILDTLDEATAARIANAAMADER